MQWEVVIGLENHVQLTTESKIFSGSPIKYGAVENKTVYFCGCKHSANKPLCDGAHKAL